MIRPRLRPTISRRNKYLTIAPRAEKKLYRESRRGSHDLRRLVGHANFLDVLVDSLDPHSDDEEPIVTQPVVSPSESTSTDSQPAELANNHDASDNDSTASEDEGQWSDSSDDDDHALVRTASGTSLVNLALAARAETEAAIVMSGDDYFSRPAPVTNEGVATVVGGRDDEKIDGVVVSDVEVTSSLSDLMEELGYGGRSPAGLVQNENSSVNVAS